MIHNRGSDVLKIVGKPALTKLLTHGLRTTEHWYTVSRDLVQVMDRLGQNAGHGVLIANKINAGVFHPQDRTQCRRELKLSRSGALILMVKHLIPRKNPLLALEVFEKNAPANARLAIVGRGPLEAELRTAVQNAGLEKRVE